MAATSPPEQGSHGPDFLTMDKDGIIENESSQSHHLGNADL